MRTEASERPEGARGERGDGDLRAEGEEADDLGEGDAAVTAEDLGASDSDGIEAEAALGAGVGVEACEGVEAARAEGIRVIEEEPSEGLVHGVPPMIPLGREGTSCRTSSPSRA